MARIALITGGCRSGKSGFAQRVAEGLPPVRLYVATAPVTDAEMAARIEAHRQARRERGWETLESPLDLESAFQAGRTYSVCLVDCLTLWVNNLLFEAQNRGEAFGEGQVHTRAAAMLDAAERCAAPVIFVTNEVGGGIVPENPLARLYRDLIGRLNQIVAARADWVALVACGLPLNLKGTSWL